MAGTTDTRFWLRTSLVRGAITLALLALRGGTVWSILDDRGLAPLPRAASPPPARASRPSGRWRMA